MIDFGSEEEVAPRVQDHRVVFVPWGDSNCYVAIEGET